VLNPSGEPDDLLRLLAGMPVQDLDPSRARVLLARATRTLARRRRFVQGRIALLAGIYGRIVEPVGAGALSVGFIVSVVAQAAFVLLHAHAGVFWR
jgi:hypothetical protein